MADSSRNILYVLLAVGIAVAVFYMMDPTLGGLLGKFEGFQDAMGPSPSPAMEAPPSTAVAMGSPSMAMPPAQEPILPPNSPPSVSGMQVEKFQNVKPSPTAEVDALVNASKALGKAIAEHAGKGKAAGFMNKSKAAMGTETFMGATGAKKAAHGAAEGFQNQGATVASFSEAPANCYPKNQLSPQELLPSDASSKWAAVNPTGQGDIAGKNFLSAGALVGVNTVGQSLRNANQQLRSEPPCPQVQVSIWNQSTIEPDLQRKPLEGF